MSSRRTWGLVLFAAGVIAMAIELKWLPLAWGSLWPLAAVLLGLALMLRGRSQGTAASWSAGIVVTIAGAVLFAERMAWVPEGLFFPALLAAFGLAMLFRPASFRDG